MDEIELNANQFFNLGEVHSPAPRTRGRVVCIIRSRCVVGLSGGSRVDPHHVVTRGRARGAQGDPRSDESRPLTGVFYTRSPARPNPLGPHPVTVREIDGTCLKIGPTEAFAGTPVLDIKSASTRAEG